jgi:protein TonB
MHISGIYRGRDVSYIELSMADASRLATRSIPKPRLRPKLPKLTDIKTPVTEPKPLPSYTPPKLDPTQPDLPDSLVEEIAAPKLPHTASPTIAQWEPIAVESGSADDFVTAQSYLEMVRLRIEQHKRYPRQAKKRNREGRVTVQFTITHSGSVQGVHIITPTRTPSLNRAAINAVEDAAPFPMPPKRFFKGDLPLKLTLVFELT